MREIEFRGKSRSTGEWRYGNFQHITDDGIDFFYIRPHRKLLCVFKIDKTAN
jgi:hypothetical protein